MKWFLLAFVVSRGAFWLLGLRFEPTHIPQMMHFVDVDLLRDRLWESVLHLQGQPPLISLVMGAVLKASGEHWAMAFHGVNLVIGILVGWTMIRLLRRLGVREGVACVAAVVFSLLPQCLVYESYWFFTYPLAWLLLLLCERAVAAAQDDSFAAWSGLFLTAAALTLLKNLFHPLWMVAVVAVAIRGAPNRRRAAVAAIFPLLLTLSWPVKNAIVFGSPGTSSWVGFGLARKTWHRQPIDQRVDLVQEGARDPITEIQVYGGVSAFARVEPLPEPTGVPLLDRRRKASGYPNYHHAIYAPVTSRMRDEALRLIRERPSEYLDNVAHTFDVLLRPSTRWRPLSGPRQQIAWWCDPIESVLHAPVAPPLRPWGLLAAAVLLLSAPALWRTVLRPRSRTPRDRFLALAITTIAWVWCAGILLDTGETMRLRFMTDGLVFAAAVTLLPISRSTGRPR